MLAEVLSGFRVSVKAAPVVDSHVRFVVMGHQRCGSNLLTRMLGEHPEVRISGEVLRGDLGGATDGWKWAKLNPGAWGGSARPAYAKGRDGWDYLDRVVYGGPWVSGIKASGCKLFYDQGRSDESIRRAWDYVLKSDVRIIHLIRRNLLDALISLESANRTNRWIHPIEQGKQAPPQLAPFHLDPEVCHQYFDRMSNWRQWAATTFAGSRMLTVDYDKDLCAEFEWTSVKTQKFLGLTARPAKPALIKQQSRKASEQVVNYDELARYFRMTPYEEFFAS
jgi:LPS sulfotransferase NodH